MAIGFFLGTRQNRARNEGKIDPLSSIVRRMASTPAVWVGERMEGMSDFWGGFTQASQLRQEVTRLRAENQVLRLYTDRETELSRRIADLEGLLKTKSSVGGQKILGRVSGFHVYEDRATLNVGSSDGVVAGAAVVANSGLLGVIQTVDAKSSQVLLISSSSCRIGAKVNTNPPLVGLLKGESANRLVFETNITDRPMTSGQRVVTNGLSDSIPPGILIGYVERSESSAEFGASRAKVIPVENLAEVREVWVIKP